MREFYLKKLYFLDILAQSPMVRHAFTPLHRYTATPLHRYTAMKRWFDYAHHKWAHILPVLFALSMFACQGWGNFWEDKDKKTGTTTPSGTSGTSACATAVVSDSVTMICIPANTAGFLRGSTAVGGSAIPEHTVASITAFAMAKYEVQYADWVTVKTWATANGYTFANPGVQGDNGARTNQDPVTTLNWRDAIIWCNAASEKQGLTPVYFTNAGFTTPLKTSTNTGSVNATAGSEDTPYVNWPANGYRLPTEAEWEYVARYIDGTTFMRGDAPSGWLDNNPANGLVDAAENDPVAWYTTNSASMTHAVGGKAANTLSIFDMSGNVWEWTWDWYASNYTTASPYTDADSKGPTSGTYRVVRGGGWSNTATNLRAADRSSSGAPWVASNGIGFRPVRRP